MIHLKVNTIIYEESNRLYKITIPPSMIPTQIKERFQKQIEKINEIKRDLEKKGLSPKEIREKIKEVKQDEKNEINYLFALFLNLGQNMNLLSFRLDTDKSKYSDEDVKVEEATEMVNSFKEIKEIQLIPYSPKTKEPYKEFKKDTLEVLEDYKSKTILYEDIIVTLLRLMRTTRISSKYYQDNHTAFFNKYLKFNDKEGNIVNELFNNNVKNDKPFTAKLKNIPYYEVK